MSLPVFFPPAEVVAGLPRGERLTLIALCGRAGIACRVSGPSARRRVRLARGAALRALRLPGPLAEVWISVPGGSRKRQAFLALGVLAYAIFDYGARESLRGLAQARATAGPGRPSSGKALSSVERQRQYRRRLRGDVTGPPGKSLRLPAPPIPGRRRARVDDTGSWKEWILPDFE